MKKLIYPLVMISMLLFSCKKKEDNSADQTNSTTNSTSNTGGTFTPPTTSFFKVDNYSNDPSMDAVSCMLNGSSTGVTKTFNSAGISTAQIRLNFDSIGSSSGRDIAAAVEEGKYIEYSIDSNMTTAAGTVKVELDEQSGGGIYFYKAGSGKIYVSKKNGKLRYTSNGKIDMVGRKYLGSGGYTRQVEFSLECGAQF